MQHIINNQARRVRLRIPNIMIGQSTNADCALTPALNGTSLSKETQVDSQTTELTACGGARIKSKRYSVRCGWCQKHLYFSDYPNSHGICHECADKLRSEL
jgi:hypothetical protein